MDYLIRDWEGKNGGVVMGELRQTFETFSGRFPEGYAFEDFLENTFRVERGTPEADIPARVIANIRAWRSNKALGVFIEGKEVIKGELLRCIEDGVIPVLDEIDKISDRDLDGLLAFLDLETGRCHRIQGMDRDIYIPKWFGVYATSNHPYKPVGPLGRRFSSVTFGYLGRSDMLLYLLARLTDRRGNHPFGPSEIAQILAVVDIVSAAATDNAYSSLDFSLRMLDTFVQRFTSRDHHRIVKHARSGASRTYILSALRETFELQTEDVLGGSGDGKLTNQKANLLKIIDGHIRENTPSGVRPGRRIATRTRVCVSGILSRIGMVDRVLRDIVTSSREEQRRDTPTRILDYSTLVGRLLSISDAALAPLAASAESPHDARRETVIETDTTITVTDTTLSLTLDTQR